MSLDKASYLKKAFNNIVSLKKQADGCIKSKKTLLKSISAHVNSDFDVYYAVKNLKDNPQYLRELIMESPVSITHCSAYMLAKETNARASNVILQMINNKEDEFEQSIGLLIFGARIREINENRITSNESLNSTELVHPFLNSKNELLQLYATFSLMWMQTPQAENVLRDFASHNPDCATGKMINNLLPAGKTIHSLPSRIVDWMDVGHHLTSFFRYPLIYNELKDEIKSHPDNFTVWEAGCSVGLTTESISITLNNEINKQSNKASVNIIGTEINPFTLWYAKRGVYLLDYGNIGALKTKKGTEKHYIKHYFRTAKLNESIIEDYFSQKTGTVSGAVISAAKRDLYPISFLHDDITSEYSQISDDSVDIIIYTNVHHELHKDLAKALEKIKKKLKNGGKIYLIDPKRETYLLFNWYFGNPIKSLSDECDKICIYQKQKYNSLIPNRSDLFHITYGF